MQLERKYVSEIRIKKDIEEDNYLNDVSAVKYLKNTV